MVGQNASRRNRRHLRTGGKIRMTGEFALAASPTMLKNPAAEAKEVGQRMSTEENDRHRTLLFYLTGSPVDSNRFLFFIHHKTQPVQTG